ncbi:hypothetical protein WR25_24987 [Diploscapter pachys]|uniref:Serpin domain-containing protein n=1 Tax=Diploscapter pachys TaxID=2018661 RepID=A0A2A2JG35_9BILA|nr:hypothetical protein WR25_24987 [Diploscapter pachys]
MFLEAETSFGVGVLQQFPLNESFVFSPLSIALALSLVHIGAKGGTKTEIGNAICKGANDDQLKQHYSFFTSAFANPAKGVEINLANKAFINKKYPLKKSYLTDIANAYKASAENVDFSDQTKAAAVINGFVKEHTKGRINEIIEKSKILRDSTFEICLAADSMAFLINALYLNVKWIDPFFPQNTVQADFFARNGQDRKAHIYEEVQILALNYTNPEYRFIVVLPKQAVSLQKFIQGLSGEKFQSLLKTLKRTSVQIKIPKMKVETSSEMKKILTSIGIKSAFEDGADFSPMSDVPLKVSEVTHKAVIDVNEAGTTASAATVVEMLPGSAGGFFPDPIEFTADHPFLYTITFNNHPLFMGAFV